MLTWEIGSGLTANNTSGKLVFSQITMPTKNEGYTGDEFSGTVTYPQGADDKLEGTYTYIGKVGPVPDNKPGDIQVPAQTQQNKGGISDMSGVLKIVKAAVIFTIVAGVMGLMGKGVVAAFKGLKARSQRAKDAAEKASRIERLSEKGTENLEGHQARVHQEIEELKNQID
ncbi:MAG: hypothetical protein GY765_37625, partial [bacterium]|nr:hypothetical protein [bacterium]